MLVGVSAGDPMLMHWDPKAVFDAVASHVPEALVGARRLELCRQVAGSLPRATLSYYLECRLDQDDQVDFLTLTRHNRAADLFRASLGDAAQHRAWERTLDLLADWRRVGSPLERVPFLWLEYDIDAEFRPGRPLASPGFCLESDYLARFWTSPIVDRELAIELSAAGLERLLLPAERELFGPLVQRCVEALPAGGSLIHVSAMLARDPLQVKLYLAVPKAGLLSYLDDIGWPGHAEQLRDVLSTSYYRIPSTVFIDVSLRSGLDPTLGLAFSQLHQTEMDDFDPSWSWLPMDGTCVGKRDAARGWPGTSEMQLEGVRCWIHRWLDVKVVLDAAGACRFKAYLGFMATPPPPFA